MKPKVIAFANHKGGVGKTTCVACLGVALARMGRNVLLIDLDSQANLTSFFLPDGTTKDGATTYDTLIDGKPLPVMELREGLSLVPASLELGQAERLLTNAVARESKLKFRLDPIKGSYDYILLDCSPYFGTITTNALVASDAVIVPITPSKLALRGLKMTEMAVQEIRDALGSNLHIEGIILNLFDARRSISKEIQEAVALSYKDILFNTAVRNNVKISDVNIYGGDIFDYAPESNGAKDFTALAQEFLNK